MANQNNDMSSRAGFITRRFSILLTGMLLSGCMAVGGDYVREPLPAEQTHWIDRANVAVAEEEFVAWWRDLGDPELARLIETALENNLTIRQGLSRIEEANARRIGARAARYPGVDTESSATVLQQSLNSQPGIALFPGFERRFEQYALGASLNWQVDLWGQTRRRIDAADARVELLIAAANGARLAIASETAATYFTMTGFQQEKRALLLGIEAQRTQLDLAKTRLKAGAISRAELILVEAELARLEEQLPGVEAEIQANALSLGVLTGRLPESEIALADRVPPLLELPEIPVGTRADLLKRRPDVARLERELAAQTYEIGVAKGELFPQLALNASGGFTSIDPGALLSGDSTRFSIVPFLSWRILDGGRVQADIRLAQAEARTAALAYVEGTLTAIEEAEIAIAQYDLAREGRPLALRTIALAQENLRLSRIRFEAGDIDRFELQDAERTYSNALRNGAISYRNSTLTLAQLYAALGGGWQAVPPPPALIPVPVSTE